MEEYVDVMDAEGRYTGESVPKSLAHSKGLFHPTVHIWFYTREGYILLQQRGRSKPTFPMLWDVSVAGHVSSGESISDAAIREIEEEIGLSLEKGELHLLGVFKSEQLHHKTLIDREFHHSFLCELNTPLAALRKQDSEVEALKLIPLHTLAEEVWGMANPQRYVPHDISYYKAVIKAIKERL
ncbi:NUDIX hydrolase [Lentiprolixibacter aurantiacus]|uniref:NUDIX domain-containing protein n=1 Tax=Lentiprolixibacter aurantiacus TaxID=2993939 RepID=A0AAE3MLS3_9FLAO|nr:NUDIX domain-containing protein [Lentiprolixibacter aurantiacus]MCX2720190.1 NUDIX domain-containing protein [Lentiprolixibacter aurantiacus]